MPKCLLEIGGQPIMDYQLSALRHVGVDDIVVVTGHRGTRLKAHYGSHLRWTSNPFFDTTNSLASLWCARAELGGGCLYLHSDVVFSAEILASLLACPWEFCLSVDEKPCDAEDMKVRCEASRVMEINKSMDPHRAWGEFIGIAKIAEPASQRLHHMLETLMEARAFDAYVEAAFQRLIDQGERIHAHAITGACWMEIDTERDLQAAEQRMVEGALRHG